MAREDYTGSETCEETKKASLRLQAISRQVDFYPLRKNLQNFGDIVEVAISGSDCSHEGRTRFLLHRDLLVHHSPFFTRALTGGFSEGHTQRIVLPEVALETFGILAEWLYTQSLVPDAFLSSVAAKSPPEKDSGSPEVKPMFFLLLDLYILADRCSMEALRNDAVSLLALLADRTNCVPTPSDTQTLYNSVRVTAPIRDLIIDLFAFKKTDSLLATHPAEWNARFLRDLVVRLKRPLSSSLSRHKLVPLSSILSAHSHVPSNTTASAATMAGPTMAPPTALLPTVILATAIARRHAENGSAVTVSPMAMQTFLRTCDICHAPMTLRSPGAEVDASSAQRAGVAPQVCCDCGKAVCSRCAVRGEAVGDFTGRDVACKPWRRDICRYHEHTVTAPCRPKCPDRST